MELIGIFRSPLRAMKLKIFARTVRNFHMPPKLDQCRHLAGRVVSIGVILLFLADLNLIAQEPDNHELRLRQLEEQLQLQMKEINQLEEALKQSAHAEPSDWGSVDYDNGLILTPPENSKTPFSMKLNGWIQFRYHGFDSSVNTWTDNAGVARRVEDRSAFDIERARLVFSGHVLDERLTYFLQLDGDTDGGHAVDFFDYYWAWEFDEALSIELGKRKVSASRQWLLGARHTRLIDRPMATDFFRPDRTVGIWAVGELPVNIHYELNLGNGYRTSNFSDTETDDRLTFAATSYIDPLGDYGSALVDFKPSENPLVRLGHSFVYSHNSGEDDGDPYLETNFLRLTDGTRLTDLGALAPGVRVSEVDIYYYSVDAAFKYQGWSLDAEVYLVWLEQLKGNGPLPVSDLMQHGYYVEGGYFLIPEKLDCNLRYSEIDGFYGHGREIAGGINYYPLKTAAMKLSFDVTRIIDSPMQNTASDIFVGDDGMLYRTQFQAEF
ncbi:MAG: porin [Planctomyces sp.]|nr:porin [Planctomyces sp.]